VVDVDEGLLGELAQGLGLDRQELARADFLDRGPLVRDLAVASET
jgi:hypothetical protein